MVLPYVVATLVNGVFVSRSINILWYSCIWFKVQIYSLLIWSADVIESIVFLYPLLLRVCDISGQLELR